MFLILGLFGNPFNSPRTPDSTASPEPPPKARIHFWEPKSLRPCKLRLTPLSPFLLLLLSLSFLLYALRRSTLSASVEQEHRTESQLCAHTHARTASCGIPHGASGLPVPSASSAREWEVQLWGLRAAETSPADRGSCWKSAAAAVPLAGAVSHRRLHPGFKDAWSGYNVRGVCHFWGD